MRSISGVLASCLAIGAAHADEDDLDALYGGAVEIATGYDKPARLAPAVVETITAEDIRALGAQTLDEVMTRAAGVVVQTDRVGDPIYTFRGLYSELNAQVLILIDGAPIGDPVAGGRPIAWNNLVSNIEKIEIVRGPGSALFGADAFAGVINVITKGAVREEISEIGGYGGSFGTGGGHLIKSFDLGGSKLTATLQGRRTAGDETRVIGADAQTFLDQLTGTTASNAPAAFPSERSEVLVRLDFKSGGFSAYGYYNGFLNVGPGFTSSFQLSDTTEYNVNLGSIGAAYREVIGETAIEIKARGLLTDLSSRTLVSPEGAATPAPPFTLPFDAFSVFEYKTIDARIEGNATRSFGDHTLRAGVGGIHQSSFDIVDQRNFLLTPLGPVPGPSPTLLDAQDLGQPPQTDGTTRHVGYAFVQDEWQISSDLTATVGMRFDHYSDLGGTFNPRASLVWTPTLTTTVKLLYGSAFRPPTFLESATDENGPIVSGSAELNAETVDTFEAAIEQRLAPDLRLSLNGFFYRTDEEILVENTLAGPRFLNGMGVRGVGMEASLVYAPKGPIRVRANYALADVTNRETETAAPNVARHIAFVDLGVAPTPSFAINTILSYVGERSRAFADPRPPLDDYLRTDLTLRYTPRGLEGLSATLAARNLFDADLADPTTDALFAPGDLPLEGRRLTFFVDFSF